MPITPLPLPPGAVADLVVLFGGSFDPPHNAHVVLPPIARDQLERRAGCPRGGWLIYVPAARSPFKPDPPRASDLDRVEMLRGATADVARCGIWTDELDRARRDPATPSYTVETIRRARGLLGPGVRLALLIGADQAAGFHRWKEPHEVLALAEPAVMLRGDDADSADELIELLRSSGFWTPDEIERWRAGIVRTPVIDASATRVRELLSQSPDDPRLRTIVPPAALGYILRRGLYR